MGVIKETGAERKKEMEERRYFERGAGRIRISQEALLSFVPMGLYGSQWRWVQGANLKLHSFTGCSAHSWGLHALCGYNL